MANRLRTRYEPESVTHAKLFLALSPPVYATKDGRTSVGFVPGGEYLMFDAFGIGLVSARPYKKVKT